MSPLKIIMMSVLGMARHPHNDMFEIQLSPQSIGDVQIALVICP
jgi:hypothetical protein